MDISRAVKSLREHLKETQQQFGDRLGVTDAAVCYWESGDNGVHKYYREQLAALARDEKAPAKVVRALEIYAAREVRT